MKILFKGKRRALGKFIKDKFSFMKSVKEDEEMILMIKPKEKPKPKLSGKGGGVGSEEKAEPETLEEVLEDIETPPTGDEEPAAGGRKRVEKSADSYIHSEKDEHDRERAEEIEDRLNSGGLPDLDELKPPCWFTAKLKSILRDNAIKRHAGNKEYGDLDHKKLFKLGTTGKIFKRKAVQSAKQYKLGLVIDCSGSMSGRPMEIAAISAGNLIGAFQELIDLEVMTFNARERILKPFNEKKISSEKIMDVVKHLLIEARMHYAVGNHDHIALKKMVQNLMQSGHGEKILIIISDGQPSCGCGQKDCGSATYLDKRLKEELVTAESRGVKVLSVGVGNSRTRDYYKHNKDIGDIHELYPAIIELLLFGIKRRRL